MKKVISFIFDADSMAGRIICCILYILFYDYMFENFVYKLFSYMGGVDYVEMTFLKRLSWIVISVIPIIAYQKIEDASSFICLFLYLFVYLPFVHALFTLYGISNLSLYAYTGILCCLFFLYFCIGRFGTPLKNLDFSPSIPLVYIEIATLLLTIIFIAFRANSMHFVNIFTQLDVLYSLREENSENSSGIGLILYIQGWLSGAFYPFLLVCYLNQKSWLKTIGILCGYILLFMADMQKITFLLPFALIGMYYLIKLKEEIICMRLHSYIVLGVSLISIILFIIQDENNKVLFTLISIVLLRTVCVAGWLTQNYYHFFQENPYTYYTHINIVNALTGGYPYDRPLGQAVAYGAQNANANMFLTDGMAAAGLVGIIFIGCIFLVVLYFINAISYKYKKTDLFVIFLPSLAYLLNVSLFTTLLSSGLLILFVILLCFDTSSLNIRSINNNK